MVPRRALLAHVPDTSGGPPGRQSPPPPDRRRPPPAPGPIPTPTLDGMSTVDGLTSLAKAGGCAAKYSAARLEELLAGIVPAEAHDLSSGSTRRTTPPSTGSTTSTALVFTVDFFPPVVDDPRTFGRDRGDERAQRRLRDGRPAAARALRDGVPGGAAGLGAGRRARRSGRGDAGGGRDPGRRAHDPRRRAEVRARRRRHACIPTGVWLKSGARPGDAVLLTKPLGTGLVLQAVRDGRAPDGSLEAAVAAMCELNRDAADALRSFTPNAVTDVTGFGLLGHAHETAVRSGVRIALDAGALPALPGALELAAAGVRTGGDRRNREFAGAHVRARRRRSSRRSRTTRRRPAGCSSRSRPTKRAVLEATFAGGRASAAPRWAASRPGSGVSPRAVRLRERLRGPVAPAPVPPASRSASVVALGLVVTSGAVRPADRLGPRLRQLAAVRRHAVPREGLPRDGRVRQPRGRARRDPRRAR